MLHASIFSSLLLSIGCQPGDEPGTSHPKAIQQSTASGVASIPFDIDRIVGDSIVVEGSLYGSDILGPTGKRFGTSHKGSRPIMIKLNSVPLALVPKTDDIAEQLFAAAQQTVQLTGIVKCEPVGGRAPSP